MISPQIIRRLTVASNMPLQDTTVRTADLKSVLRSLREAHDKLGAVRQSLRNVDENLWSNGG